MLRYLRENTGNWIIKIFLFIIVIVFVFLGVGSMNATREGQVATVNDSPITIKEYQEAYKNMVQAMRQQFGNALNDELLQALNVKQQTLNTLIDRKVMDMAAENLKIVVSDQEVRDRLMAAKAFQREGQFDMDLYKRVLGLNQMTPESYEAFLRQSIKESKLKEMVLNSIIVSDAEAMTWYNFQNTKTDLEFIEIDPAGFSDVQVTDEEIETYYQENKDQYQSEPKRSVAYLVFSPKDYAGSVGVTDEQVKTFYNDNIDQFKVPEKVEASHILIRLDADADEAAVESARKEAMAVYEKAARGEAFDALAKEFSQGPSGPNGGYLGVFERESMVKPFADAAFAMKAGEISKPVKTQFGWHVIKVSQRMAAKTETLAEVSDRIRSGLEKEELNNQAYYKAGEAFDLVMDGDDFEQVALIAKKEVIKTPAFTATGEGLAMENAAAFARAAFSLERDDISDVKQLGDSYYIMQVIEAVEPEQLSLDSVKADIIAALTTEKQTAAAREKADEMLKEALAAGSLQAFASAKGLDLKTSGMVTRTQPVSGIAGSKPLVDAAFTLDKTQPVFADVVAAGGRFYLVGFKDRQLPDTDQAEAGLAEVKNELTARKQQQHLVAWMDELKSKAQIRVDKEFMN